MHDLSWNKLLRLPAVAATLLLYSCTARGPEKAFDKGDYATAAELWLHNAEQGDRSAICPMMVALELTHDTTKVESLGPRLAKLLQSLTRLDAAEKLKGQCASTYLQRAAGRGNSDAQYYLADSYQGAPQERERLLEMAAKHGSSKAQFAVGAHYRFKGDFSSAARWWKLSADNGYALAQQQLGDLYREGIGVPQDLTAGANLIEQAAQQGSFSAQMKIGEIYEKGQGVPQDFMKAYFWFNAACATAPSEYDRQRADQARDQIAQQVKSDHIIDAERLADGSKPSSSYP
jgi:TPR repeat protein